MPPTLGQRLKHAREKRGLALADIAHETKIPATRLKDLENDNLTTFGSLTYAKSFLRTYAGYLGVDAEEVAQRMQPPPLGGLQDYRYLVENHGPWITSEDDHTAMAPAPTITSGRSFAFAALICLAFGLLIGGGVLANAFFHSKAATAAADTPPEASPGTGSTATNAAAFSATTPAPEQPNLSPEAFRAPDPPSVPKAVPVPEPPSQKQRRTTAPPKAEAVR